MLVGPKQIRVFCQMSEIVGSFLNMPEITVLPKIHGGLSERPLNWSFSELRLRFLPSNIVFQAMVDNINPITQIDGERKIDGFRLEIDWEIRPPTFQSVTMVCVSRNVAGAEVTQAVTHEMPVELLRASLPFIDEAQHRILREVAQRSMPMVNNRASSGNGNANSEFVPN